MTGISNGLAYYYVTALIHKWFVRLKNFTHSKKKSKYLYELTPRGVKAKVALTVQFPERKREDYSVLRAEKSELSFS